MTDQPARPAGWKKDPTGRHYGRWWDGSEWTENVISADKAQGVDPLPPRAEPSLFDDVPPAPSRAPSQLQYRGPAPTAPGWTPDAGGKRKKDGGVKVWKIALGVMLGIFGVMVACAVVIGGAANEAVKDLPADQADGGRESPGTAPEPKTVYKVGDTAKTGDFDVTVYGFKDPQTTTNQFDKPAAGNRFISVDVQVANRGSAQKTFSSLVGLHLVDGANRQYDIRITTVEPKAPDGQIPAGGAVRGLAVFEVPDGTTGLRLRVQGGITASGAFFTLA